MLQAQGHHPPQPPHSPPPGVSVTPHSHTARAHTTTRPPVFSFPTLHLGSFDSSSQATAQNTDIFATDPSAAQPFRPSSPDSMSSRSSSSGRQERVPSTTTTMALPTLPSLSPISPIGPPSPSYYSASSLRRPDSALYPPFPAYDDASNSSSSGTFPTLHSNRPLGHSLTIAIPGPLTPSPSDREAHGVPSPPVFKPSPGIARRRTVIQQSSVAYEPSPVRVSETSGTITPPRDMSRSPTRARAEGSGADRDGGADGDRRERQVSVERGSILMPEPQPTPQPTPLLQQRPLQAAGTEAGAGSGSVAPAQSPRRLEKKTASHDLRNTSPSSPTTRRSLPRPPQPTGRDSGMAPKPSISDLSQATAHQPSASSFPQPHPRQNPPAPAQQPQQRANSTPATSPPAQPGGTFWPPLNIGARTPQALSSPGPASHPVQQRVPPPQAQAATHAQQPKPAPAPAPDPAFNQRHQQNASASTLPVIGGLADAGPYPSGGAPSRPAPPQLQSRVPAGARAPSITNQAGVGANGVGMGRPPVQTGAGGGNGQTRRPPPQEEVCLECMMRDRDLADVDVQGPGVWGRASDAGFEDLRWREEALLKSMGDLESGSPPTGGFRKFIDDDSSGSSDEGGSSALSKGGSVEDAQRRNRAEELKRKRSMVRAKKREANWRVCKEIGWRGFKWEEGGDGEGLPVGFRGSKGAKLTEDGIKAIMAKFPSASAHRYQKLQDYLRNQWQLILEIRTEAQRIGHYPLPGEDAASAPSSRSSHDASPAARFPPGALPSALTFDRSAASGSGSGPFTPMRGTNPSLAVMRPSPSSPANLTGLAQGPRLAAPLQRPLTHYLPDREPVLTPLRGSSGPGGSGFASPGGSTARGRHAKNTSSPGMLEKAGGDDNEELWEPGGGEGGSGLRPFSFAVRAGAAAARDGSEGGHGGGRRSLWGRWGGSVTSLFGGSQNGSGSMVDMHVGLDTERRNRTSSYNVESYPRAVSLASPTRPSFFSRDSRTSSIDHAPESGARMSRAISHSRLSQFHTNEDGQDGMQRDDDVGGYTGEEPKKKGIKGFFKKMKPKGPRKGSTRTDTSAPPLPQHQGYARGDAPASAPAPETPLAPPPPISILVGRGDKTHSRQGSGSSSSFFTDQESPAPAGSNARYSSSGYGLPYATYGARSVSAPLGGNGSSSELSQGQSASPSSSRFATATGAGKRDSYASTGRRRSGQVNEMGEEMSRSVMETLSTSVGSGGGAGGFGEQMYDEPQTMRGGAAQQQQVQGQGYPHPSFRPHNKTNSSLSASSGTMLETPPPVSYGSGAFFQQQVAAQQQAKGGGPSKAIAVNTNVNGNDPNATPVPTSPTAPLSPNRFKNLPPIPPPGAPEPQQQPNVAASPDSFVAAFPEQEFSLTGTVHDPKYAASGPRLGSPAQVQTRGVAQQGQHGQQYGGKQAIDFSAGSTYTRREPVQAQNPQMQQQQQMQGQGYGYGYPQPQQQQQHIHPNPYGQQQQQQQQQQQRQEVRGYSLHPQPRSPANPSSPGYGAGRASLDQRSSQTRAGGQRVVQTMYGHPGMPGVVGGGYGGFDEGEKKRKGLKGIFGGSKAGRMA